ncbi:MAG TPA: amidase [Chthonomonas sp.]|uniref:amidase n=1 Tax=Chthonomonas sp. TaxID=2282153 RepID=UPI002B4B1E15|nr:amidase [Chthonomonas sp.]HLI48506.1 amidase [Chthonomonas sp.]
MSEIPLHYLSAVELGRLIREKRLSSVELTRLYLERLEKIGRSLNAVAELTPELALAQARQADEELAKGYSRGPLHGVPYGAKDLLATKNIPTRWGSPAHKDQIFNYDATVIRKLREAGAVLVAKLSMIELAGGGGYDSPAASLEGPCRCPWNPSRWAGGSSSGSGAAVSAGLVGFALGTETWGSITVPAAFCGISGLRPTYGRVSRHGAMTLCWTLDKIGPMARSAEDCGFILQAIAGPDPLDATCAPIGFRFRAQPLVSRRRRPIRLGVLPHDTSKVPEVQKAFEEALAVFRERNFHIEEASYPPDIPYNEAASLIVMAEGSAAFEGLIRSERLQLLADPQQQAGLIAGLSISSADYLRAQRIRKIAIQALNALWARFDLLIAPTLLTVAPEVSKPLSAGTEPWGGNGGPGNLAGWPSLSIPMGFGKENLPLGLEIIGPPGGEEAILALGMTYQRETDWHRKHPSL